MSKIDYKKDYKDIYLPKKKPTLIELEPIKYVVVEHLGNPNSDSFQSVMSALYGFSWTIKMKSKKREDYYEYVIFPLEGIWDLIDKVNNDQFDKSNFKGTMMIRQPDFVDEELFEEYRQTLLNKEENFEVIEKIKNARFETIEEGLCIQMLHIGSYDSEPETFVQMEAYCQEEGYERISKVHKEIYLSDPRKVEPDKLRTVLRFKVKKK